jgi:hypothetical protein
MYTPEDFLVVHDAVYELATDFTSILFVVLREIQISQIVTQYVALQSNIFHQNYNEHVYIGQGDTTNKKTDGLITICYLIQGRHVSIKRVPCQVDQWMFTVGIVNNRKKNPRCDCRIHRDRKCHVQLLPVVQNTATVRLLLCCGLKQRFRIQNCQNIFKNVLILDKEHQFYCQRSEHKQKDKRQRHGFNISHDEVHVDYLRHNIRQ